MMKIKHHIKGCAAQRRRADRRHLQVSHAFKQPFAHLGGLKAMAEEYWIRRKEEGVTKQN
jgi:hypothetical protein